MDQEATKDTVPKADNIGKKCLTPRVSTVESANPNNTSQLASEASVDNSITAGSTSIASIAGNTGLKITHQEASEDEVGEVEAAGKKSGSPHSNVDGHTPMSASWRIELRRASLSGSPPAGQGLGSPSLGFGAGLRNIPTPITTQIQPMSEGQTQALGVREPLPGSPLPGIEEKLRQLAAAQLSPTSEQDSQPLAARAPARAILKNGVNRRATLPASSVQVPSTQDRLIGQPRPSQQVNSHIVNPYIRRADAIGRRHHVPGIGHLGDLLTPPGWSPGNDPITTVEAQKLFQQARTRARTLLDLSIKQNKNLSEEEQQKRDVEEDQKWQAQLKLDQVVCSERQKLYENWQALKAQVLQAQQAGLQRQYRPENGPRQGAPQPHDLPTGTSAHAYTEYQQSQVNVFPHDYAPSRPLSAGSIHNRVQELQRSLHFPLRSPISPSNLDPSLVPETLQSVYENYYNNRSAILQMQNENELFLATWTAKFGANMPISPRGFVPQMQPANDQHARPLGVYHAYMPGQQKGRDLTQAKIEGARGRNFQVNAPGTLKPQTVFQNVLGLSQGNPGHGYFRASSRQSNRATPHRQFDNRDNSPAAAADVPSPQFYPRQPHNGVQSRMPNQSHTHNDSKDSSPKRKAPKKDTQQSRKSADHNSKIEEAKPKTWYHDAIAGANLPTSVISQQAMQAGMDFRPSGYEQQGSNKPKPRNGSKPADVPQRGFSVSLDMAERVVRMGGTDATGPALVEPPVGAFPPLATNAVAPHTGYTSSYISQPTNVIAQQSGMHPGYASYHYAPHPPNGAASQNRHLSSYTPPYQPTGVLQDDSSVRSTQQNDDTISAPNSAALSASTQLSSDTPDDPKDGTFGKRVRQRKISTPRAMPATPRKTPTIRKPSTGSKRRNSNATETSKKRVRRSLDGTADDDA